MCAERGGSLTSVEPEAILARSVAANGGPSPVAYLGTMASSSSTAPPPPDKACLDAQAGGMRTGVSDKAEQEEQESDPEFVLVPQEGKVCIDIRQSNDVQYLMG